ncbi:hypothetical protein GCM10010464_87560 [Pseudonocardia yunnanensis]
MESPAHSNGHRHGSPNRVSVAQLIICCGELRADPPLGVDHGPPASVSVGTLLRREGRAPHAADRPLQPRGHSRPLVGPPKPPRWNVLRKATAAAVVLFAVAAMFTTADVKNVVGAAPRVVPSLDGDWVDAQGVTLSVAELSAATTPGAGSSAPPPITSGAGIGRGGSGHLRNVAAPDFGGAGGSAPPEGAETVTPAEPGAAEPVARAPRATGASSAPPLDTGSGSSTPGGLLPDLGPGAIAPGGGPGGDVAGSFDAGGDDDSGRSSSNDSSRDDSSRSDRDGHGNTGKPDAVTPAWPASWDGAMGRCPRDDACSAPRWPR